MKLYDECLDGVEALEKEFEFRKIDFSRGNPVDAGRNQLIFANDTAYSLGGSNLPAVSSIALTDSSERVPCDEVLLCGKDLGALSADTPFARIALVRVNEDAMGSGDKLYHAIRKIEFTRYHVNPEGFMPRISPFSHREEVKVSRKALKKGLSFADVGKLFIEEYRRQPQVEAVKLLFITEPSFPFDKLQTFMQKSEDITKALDHLMQNVKMDCDACSLKAVCEEVEALRESGKN